MEISLIFNGCRVIVFFNKVCLEGYYVDSNETLSEEELEEVNKLLGV